MASRRFTVIEALRALIAAAVPTAEVRGVAGDDGKATKLDPQGMIDVGSGDPGTPEVDLSPPTWWWDHAIPVEMSAIGADEVSARATLDAMLGAIGAAIEADRTLGGLCLHVQPAGATDGMIEQEGTQTICWADVTITATYSTTSPLG